MYSSVVNLLLNCCLLAVKAQTALCLRSSAEEGEDGTDSDIEGSEHVFVPKQSSSRFINCFYRNMGNSTIDSKPCSL